MLLCHSVWFLFITQIKVRGFWLFIVHASKRDMSRQLGGGLPFRFVLVWMLHSRSSETLWERKETTYSLKGAVSHHSAKIQLRFERFLFKLYFAIVNLIWNA